MDDLPDWCPLTFGQDQHYVQLKRRPELRTSLYVSQRIAGELDAAAFVAALADTVRRHDALRISIREASGVPRQRARPEPGLPELVSRQTVRALSEDQFTRYVAALLRRDVLAAWNLAEEYPFRFRLLRHSAGVHAFLAVFPHVAFDGRSWSIFLHDLWSFYASLVSGQPTVPPAAGDRFIHAATRQRERFNARALTTNRRYWADRIANSPPTCRFRPVDASAAAGEDPGRARIVLGPLDRRRLVEVCQALGCTEFQWLLAAFARAVFAISPQDRICVHIPIDTRLSSEQDIVGMFVSTLPVVIDRADSLADLVAAVRSRVIAAVTHRHVGGETLRGCEEAVARTSGLPYEKALTATFVEYERSATDRGPAGLRLSRGHYRPDVDRVAHGTELRVDARPDGLTVIVATAGRLPYAAVLIGHIASSLAAGRVTAPQAG
jgi:hypothetical protein